VTITLDELDEAHARVAIDLINADSPPWILHVGSVPAGAVLPYALVYPIVAWPKGAPATALDGKSRTCVTRWYFHCAGASDQSARAVAGRIRQLLLNVRPAITGRSCDLIGQEASLPPVRDETAGSLVVDIATVYLLTTEG
jgi:hypothetical protein